MTSKVSAVEETAFDFFAVRIGYVGAFAGVAGEGIDVEDFAVGADVVGGVDQAVVVGDPLSFEMGTSSGSVPRKVKSTRSNL